MGSRDSRPGPNVVDMVDREVDDALARSFLADLPSELVGRLRDEGERADYPAGTTAYCASPLPKDPFSFHLDRSLGGKHILPVAP